VQRFLAGDSVSLVSDMLAGQRPKLLLENKAEGSKAEGSKDVHLYNLFYTYLLSCMTIPSFCHPT
jgi:hypothetical protein